MNESTHLIEKQISFLFLKFYFIFKLYITVLVLPNIKMNLPQVYMCSPFRKTVSANKSKIHDLVKEHKGSTLKRTFPFGF